MSYFIQAMQNLCPGKRWTLKDEFYWVLADDGSWQPCSGFTWLEDDEFITKELLDREMHRLQADYESRDYQRKRSSAYPPLANLADALYHQSKGDDTKMEAYLAACEAVKQKYPKGE